MPEDGRARKQRKLTFALREVDGRKRLVFMKSSDASCHYEGYATYPLHEQ